MRPVLRARLLRFYRLPLNGLHPSRIGACVPAVGCPRPSARCACSCRLAFAGAPRLPPESRAFLSPSCARVHPPLRAGRIASLLRLRAGPRLPALKLAAGPRLPAARSPAPLACLAALWSRPRFWLGLRFGFASLRESGVALRAQPGLRPFPLGALRPGQGRRSRVALPQARLRPQVGVFLFASLSLASPRGSPLVDAWSTLSRRRAPRAHGCPSLRLYEAQAQALK